ncbi:MAG: hypothetical protein K8T89_11985 [Planctomycetes bacterium]|nr:hypothetical protein [Planctomycetota bacterium]
MIRLICLALLLSASTLARAEDARFKFQKDQILTYNVVQTTHIAETTIDDKTNKPVDQDYLTKHTVVRRWKVAEIDDKGIATLEMTIVSMKWEQKLPNGENDNFDSTKPDDLNKNEMSKLIGPVVAVVRIDANGTLVEVKESKFGSKSRFTADLPFKIILPAKDPMIGQTWDRTFSIKLDPPQGTGETYEATQKYTAKAPVDGVATIGVSTSIKDMPQASEQIPLLPMLLDGDVYFNTATGQYQGSKMKLKKELMNHAGEGTKYLFESTYSEDLKVAKE